MPEFFNKIKAVEFTLRDSEQKDPEIQNIGKFWLARLCQFRVMFPLFPFFFWGEGEFRSPDLGPPERGHPDCSDFAFFFWFVPNLHFLFTGVPRFVLICSDLFSELSRTNQGNPLLPTPFADPQAFQSFLFCRWPMLVPNLHHNSHRTSKLEWKEAGRNCLEGWAKSTLPA